MAWFPSCVVLWDYIEATLVTGPDLQRAVPLVPPAPEASTGRLLSLDALRGFDMFRLLGGEQIVQGCGSPSAAIPFWPTLWPPC